MINFGIHGYQDNKPVHVIECPADNTTDVEFDGVCWHVEPKIIHENEGEVIIQKGLVSFTPTEDAKACVVSLTVNLDIFSDEDYLFMPAAVYGGNRFRSLPKPYPPMFHQDDGISPDMDTIITNVPRLIIGEESSIHLRSGDMATPCFGVYLRNSRHGILFYGEHDSDAGYTGYRFETSENRAVMRIEAPCVRKERYTMVNIHALSEDRAFNFAKNTPIKLPFRLYSFPCNSVSELFSMFMKTRKCMSEPGRLVHGLSLSQAFDVIRDKYIDKQWNEKHGYWQVSPKGEDKPYGDWQAGWVGGGLSAYALAFDDNTSVVERSRISMDTIFSSLQNEIGFIYPMMWDGEIMGDNADDQINHTHLLVRKNADILQFAGKMCLMWQRRTGTIPDNWIHGICRLADAFVKIYERYGQIGQFVDLDNGDILVGGTAGPAIAVGGLALSFQLTQHTHYLDTAKGLAHWYNEHCLKKGLLNGGPAEILQDPDSESTFGLLEGLMTLYTVTGESQWLDMAEDCANQGASWCMSYDFHFPVGSEFGRLDMHTIGSVFANVQNKHSAPGICTLSPVSLLDLYRVRRNPLYLELAQEIAHNVTQYLSTLWRPIYSHDNQKLPSGYMCERVNTSDWEGADRIGAVYRGSCWCEISAMLTYDELPGFVVLQDEGRIVVFDHVEVTMEHTGLCIKATCLNPTERPLRVKYAVWNNNSGAQDVLHEPTKTISLLPKEKKTIDIL